MVLSRRQDRVGRRADSGSLSTRDARGDNTSRKRGATHRRSGATGARKRAAVGSQKRKTGRQSNAAASIVASDEDYFRMVGAGKSRGGRVFYKRFRGSVGREAFEGEIGDVVKVKMRDDYQGGRCGAQFAFGRVLQLWAEAPPPAGNGEEDSAEERKRIEVSWLYWPEELPGGRQAWHEDRELVESDHIDVCDANDVLSTAVVLRQDEWEAEKADRRAAGDDSEDDGSSHEDAPFYLARSSYSFATRVQAPIVSGPVGLATDAAAEPAAIRMGKKKKGGAETGGGGSSASLEGRAEVTKNDAFEEALANLHVSVVPSSLPCRDTERSELYEAMRTAVEEDMGGVVFIAGQPGTGKTATVHEVVRMLQKDVDAGDVPTFNYLEINALRLATPPRAYTALHEGLTGRTLAPAAAAVKLEEMFGGGAAGARGGGKAKTQKGNKRGGKGGRGNQRKGRAFSILLLDEMDHMVTPQQTVLYNLLDWPSRPGSGLLVVGIANTMDLPERLLPRVSSRLGLKRLAFAPYGFKQIESIISARCGALKAFRRDSVQLCARKVAATSGDIRRALNLCRRAVLIAADRGLDMVDYRCIQEAVSELAVTIKVQEMRHAPPQEQVFLAALALACRQSGSLCVGIDKVNRYIKNICGRFGLSHPSLAEVDAVVLRLCDMGLLFSEGRARGGDVEVEINVDTDDVLIALEGDERGIGRYLETTLANMDAARGG